MKYDYNCLMLSIPIKNWNTWANKLQVDAIYQPQDSQYGIENDPHITICYGIHQHITGLDLECYLPQLTDLDDIVMRKLSLFTSNPEFDVLKYDIESKKLIALNTQIKNLFPVTSSYPEYIPHLTVAYLNKNAITESDLQKYAEVNVNIKPKSYIYSYQNTKLKLNAGNN